MAPEVDIPCPVDPACPATMRVAFDAEAFIEHGSLNMSRLVRRVDGSCTHVARVSTIVRNRYAHGPDATRFRVMVDERTEPYLDALIESMVEEFVGLTESQDG